MIRGHPGTVFWLAVFLVYGGCARAAESPERSLTILHTNDLHARLLPDGKGRGGFAELAAVIRSTCSGVEACLVLDAGDLVQGTPVSTLYQGVPVFEVANRVGFDASTLGNHEFDYGWDMIPQFVETAAFPVLNANMEHPEGGRLGDGSSIVIETDNGIRVGLIGVVTERLPYLVAPDQLGEWKALPVRDAVTKIVPRLEAESDLVVVLGHLTAEEERELLEIPGIDFVVSGHTHTGLKEPVVDDDTAIVRVRAFGHEVGRLDLLVDVVKDEIKEWSWTRIPVHAGDIEPDAATLEIVRAWEAKVSELVDVPIAEVGHDLDREEMRRLFEHALKEETGADLAYINKGGIRDVFLEGELLARDVWNAMPFEDHIVTATVRGSQLPQSLREARGLSADQTYRFATIDFVVAQWRFRGSADLDVEHGELLRDLLLRWIREQERID